ncbi:TetR/AcrR family transcriptional regulator [Streptomyces sp. NPDC101209]|uniref:TetR/AcrR family transcriptional regulator n=1 Tax=Streptomyces sp. NPDC101209 TaxID=3366129 RepID=UPI00382F9C8F
MHTTDVPGCVLQCKDARCNRGRILSTARQKLRDDPQASLDSIAKAAGVARRTLYGHFSSRRALIVALTQQAGDELRQAFAQARTADADPIEAMTRMVLAAWEVGDHYRMLIALGRCHPGQDMIRATLEPIRAKAIATLGRGQREGVFANHLPALLLAQALEALMLALTEENAACPGADPSGESAATAFLIAAGVPPRTAARQVRQVARKDRAEVG